ncbi:MAG: hypothetical protein ACI8YQ_000889 [Polaribacter sp.]|jgi:hypothetical protein
MKKLLPSIICLCCFFLGSINAQIIFEENFESGSLPTGWTVESNATDGGWNVGNAGSLASNNFAVPGNGSTGMAGTNDDACNCDKSNESLMSPSFNLDGITAAILSFDAVYLDNIYQGDQEDATIEVSIDGGATWAAILDLEGNAGWTSHSVDLADYIGEEIVTIRFGYDDGGGWLYGFVIDNVVVKTPPELEAELTSITKVPFGETNTSNPIKGIIQNKGANTIATLDISYAINGGTPVSQQLTGLSIPPFAYYNFELNTPWEPAAPGDYNIAVTIDMVNDATDEDDSNNTSDFDSEIFDPVIVPNKIDEIMSTIPLLTEIADAGDGLDNPTDLDFFPILGKDELWVINQRNENDGGSTVTIADASSGNPTDMLERVDGNSWHFMSLPTAIAFSSDNFFFGTSPGVRDANHGGGTFTGPTLWSSDPEIYAQPSGGNGSHMDMLHGSPFSMGIAHEVDNVFWVYDDWNKDIVRYDFVEDHGPGADDHSDAIVRRFSDIGIDANGDIPNHMILDKVTGWLYFVDNGDDRVMRLDINSGTGSNALALINEPLAEHSEITGFTAETIIDAGLDKPCGIEIFENRLLVGDYENGDIVVYDMDNNFEEMGRIPTGEEGLTGIKIGPDGNIWYTNREENTLSSASPGTLSATNDLGQKVKVKVTPNPTNGIVTVTTSESNTTATIQVTNTAGQLLMTIADATNRQSVDLSNYPSGVYIISVQGGSFHQMKKVILNR